MKNRKKGKPKNLGKHGPLRSSEGHPHRGEAEGPKRPRSVALLRRSVEVLRCRKTLFTARKISDFCSESLVFVHQ